MALTALIVFQIVSEMLTPGFMNNWGYVTFQTAGVLVAVAIIQIVGGRAGGLSWPSQLLLVGACYADHIGNDRYWYYAFPSYDKVTHFLGVAAIAACAHDCLPSVRRSRTRGRSASGRLRAALAVGVAVGVTWEFYELFGDLLVRSSRVQGWRDSSSDLLFDALGALAAVTALRLCRVAAPDSGRRGLALPLRPALAGVLPASPALWSALGASAAALLLLEGAPLTAAPVVLAACLAGAGLWRMAVATRRGHPRLPLASLIGGEGVQATIGHPIQLSERLPAA